MKRKSLCQQLSDTCDPEIYSGNPFQVIQVFPFSSERALRRRHEELAAALRLGAQEWEDEFERCPLYFDAIYNPNQEWLEQLFERLSNPQQRFVDEFFWFWPMETQDEDALEAIRSQDFAEAIGIWYAKEYDKNARIAASAKHNIAIVRHLFAVGAENDFFGHTQTQEKAEEELKHLDELWDESLSTWEQLICDEDFWSFVKEHIAMYGDQRLNVDWLQRFRDELPWALKRIHCHFAVRYIWFLGEYDLGRKEGEYDFHSDCDRHIGYLGRYLGKSDYCPANQDPNIQNVILERIEAYLSKSIREHWSELARFPEKILETGRDLFLDTSGYRIFLKTRGEEHHPVFQDLFDKVAYFCNHCAISAGKEYEKMGEAISLLERAIPIAQSPSLKATMESNLGVLKDNLQDWKEQNTCWVCKQRPAISECALPVDMFGDLQTETHLNSNQYRTKWRTVKISIPRCRKCSKVQPAVVQYPPIKALLKKGFRFGQKPTEEECRLHYLMTQKALLIKEHVTLKH